MTVCWLHSGARQRMTDHGNDDDQSGYSDLIKQMIVELEDVVKVLRS
jgi:hypothetical protein